MSHARVLSLVLALSLTPGALAAVAMSGCDQSAPRPDRQAQEQAPAGEGDKTATLRRDGPGPDEALRDFAERQREFRAQTERELADLDRAIGALERDAAAASGEAKQGLEATLAKARSAREAVRQNLAGADTVVEATWGSFKEKVRRHFGEARVSIETRSTPP